MSSKDTTPSRATVGRGRLLHNTVTSMNNDSEQALKLELEALQQKVADLSARPQGQSSPAASSGPDTSSQPIDTQTHPIEAVGSVKLPPFWQGDAAVWFGQVEAIFHTRRITAQQSKYSYVVGALNAEVAMEVRDLVLSCPVTDPYDTIKSALIARTAVSEQKRLTQLLSTEELGDRTPSQLLRKMQQLLGTNDMDTALFRQLFEQRLPHNVRMVLASLPSTMPLVDVASMADRIVEVATPAPVSVSTIDTTSTKQELVELRSLLSTLSEKVDRLMKQSRGRSRSRHRSPGPTPKVQTTGQATPGGSSDTAVTEDLCYYHRRFGSSAYRCQAPCKFQQQQGN